MQLRYTDDDGEMTVVHLGEDGITIGRAPDADIVITDERASRYHCGIRNWDGDYVVKDLKSRNGTFVNDKAINTYQLEVGDQIRIGATVFYFEKKQPRGSNTALQEIAAEMEEGKGYGTILREIVSDSGDEEGAK